MTSQHLDEDNNHKEIVEIKAMGLQRESDVLVIEHTNLEDVRD